MLFTIYIYIYIVFHHFTNLSQLWHHLFLSFMGVKGVRISIFSLNLLEIIYYTSGSQYKKKKQKILKSRQSSIVPTF